MLSTACMMEIASHFDLPHQIWLIHASSCKNHLHQWIIAENVFDWYTLWFCRLAFKESVISLEVVTGLHKTQSSLTVLCHRLAAYANIITIHLAHQPPPSQQPQELYPPVVSKRVGLWSAGPSSCHTTLVRYDKLPPVLAMPPSIRRGFAIQPSILRRGTRTPQISLQKAWRSARITVTLWSLWIPSCRFGAVQRHSRLYESLNV